MSCFLVDEEVGKQPCWISGGEQLPTYKWLQLNVERACPYLARRARVAGL